jgi:hypothetical protein
LPLAQLEPQSTMPPQPSEMSPHCAPVEAHVRFVQEAAPHTFAAPPPPQLCPAAHDPVPHMMAPPHPSGYCPQFMPLGHWVIGVQAGAPHLPGTPPPPHVVPVGQVPQFRGLPQPSPARPHE